MPINTEPKHDRWSSDESPGEIIRNPMLVGVILPTVINSPHAQKKPLGHDHHGRSGTPDKRNNDHFINEVHVSELEVDHPSLNEYDGLLAAKGANFEGKIKAERPTTFGMAGKGLVVAKGYPDPLPLPQAQSLAPPAPTAVVEPKKMSRRVIYLNDNNNTCKWVGERRRVVS